MKRKYIFLSLLLLSLWLNPITLTAQIKRSDSFKEKYSLKEVVVLSRHNIRSPLSNGGSVLGKLTPHQWTDWSSSASELTLRGGALETIMGQFFRKWLVKEGLFQENYVPLHDDMLVYANSMQRTIATARYFSAGFMPIADVQVHHRFSPCYIRSISSVRSYHNSFGNCSYTLSIIAYLDFPCSSWSNRFFRPRRNCTATA